MYTTNAAVWHSKTLESFDPAGISTNLKELDQRVSNDDEDAESIQAGYGHDIATRADSVQSSSD
jgi:hypothetical protein